MKLIFPFFLFFYLSFGSVVIEAFYNPNCGCCHKYFEKLEKQGFKVKRNPIEYRELLKLKTQLGIPVDKRSCHTMVMKDGKFIEGHVPVEGIKALMNSKAKGVYSPHGVKSASGDFEKVYELIK